jgi:nitrate/nitrite-specific signal transduction histidine kinase
MKLEKVASCSVKKCGVSAKVLPQLKQLSNTILTSRDPKAVKRAITQIEKAFQKHKSPNHTCVHSQCAADVKSFMKAFENLFRVVYGAKNINKTMKKL